MIGLLSAVTVAVAHQNGLSGDATHIRVEFESDLRVYLCCESHPPCSRAVRRVLSFVVSPYFIV